jgi:4-amino-4-deoxy-L-arabinose transferase-like glycosyltransferase
MINSKQAKIILFIIIILVLCCRFVNIDADRPLPIFAHSNDEFYKSSSGIYKANFGTWFNDDENSGLLHAPLFGAIQYPIYELFGVSLASTRLISAIGGVLSVLLLYLILRKENKKLALFASFLLSINYVFFILTRVGIPNSIIITFLLLSFYMVSLNEKKKFNYLIAGFIMGLTVLIKVNFLYFIIAPIIFLSIQKLTKKINFSHIAYYFLPFFLILISYYFYFNSFPKDILEPMIILSKGLSMSYLFLPRLILLFVDSIFKYPSIFILSIITTIYFLFQNFPNQISLKLIIKYFNQYSFSEKISFSWLFGSIISVIFTSIAPRRIITIIIPLVIYSSILLFDKEKISLKNNKNEKNNKLSIFYLFFPWLLTISLFINYAIFMLENAFLKLEIFNLTDKVPTKISFIILDLLKNKIFFLTLAFLILITIFMIIVYIKYNGNQKFIKHIKMWSIFCLISLFIFGFIKFTYQLFIENSYYLSHLGLVLTSLLVSFILFKKLVDNPMKFTRNAIFTYVSYCFIMIICFTLLFPSFSIKEASQEIGGLTNEGDFIIGYFSPGLSIESNTKPIFNKFLPPWKDFINYSVTHQYKPKLFLVSPTSNYPPREDDIQHELKYITRFELAPVLTFGEPRVIIDLYEIDYNYNYSIIQDTY